MLRRSRSYYARGLEVDEVFVRESFAGGWLGAIL